MGVLPKAMSHSESRDKYPVVLTPALDKLKFSVSLHFLTNEGHLNRYTPDHAKASQQNFTFINKPS